MLTTSDLGATGPKAATPDRAVSGYTLHLDFTAPSEHHALLLAVALADGLGRLRPEVDPCSARLSSMLASGETQPVFCGATGPGGERCADEPDHGGWHAEGGIDGLVWADNQPREIRLR